jgi:hypothetical protein
MMAHETTSDKVTCNGGQLPERWQLKLRWATYQPPGATAGLSSSVDCG